jgi:ATP-dependent Clp protease ATP-binding subunit ClpA
MEPQAIDLVDEAASALQVARGSKPEAIDAAERALMRLRIEEEALSKEKDKASRARLAEVRREVAEAQESLRPLLLQFEGERRRAEELKALMAKRDALLARLEQAQLRNDIVSAADILHGALPEVSSAASLVGQSKHKTSWKPTNQLPNQPLMTTPEMQLEGSRGARGARSRCLLLGGGPPPARHGHRGGHRPGQSKQKTS